MSPDKSMNKIGIQELLERASGETPDPLALELLETRVRASFEGLDETIEQIRRSKEVSTETMSLTFDI